MSHRTPSDQEHVNAPKPLSLYVIYDGHRTFLAVSEDGLATWRKIDNCPGVAAHYTKDDASYRDWIVRLYEAEEKK